jgi:hypothetical protein
MGGMTRGKIEPIISPHLILCFTDQPYKSTVVKLSLFVPESFKTRKYLVGGTIRGTTLENVNFTAFARKDWGGGEAGQSLFRPAFEPGISRIQARSVTF